jgi:hypothetical protein
MGGVPVFQPTPQALNNPGGFGSFFEGLAAANVPGMLADSRLQRQKFEELARTRAIEAKRFDEQARLQEKQLKERGRHHRAVEAAGEKELITRLRQYDIQDKRLTKQLENEKRRLELSEKRENRLATIQRIGMDEIDAKRQAHTEYATILGQSPGGDPTQVGRALSDQLDGLRSSSDGSLRSRMVMSEFSSLVTDYLRESRKPIEKRRDEARHNYATRKGIERQSATYNSLFRSAEESGSLRKKETQKTTLKYITETSKSAFQQGFTEAQMEFDRIGDTPVENKAAGVMNRVFGDTPGLSGMKVPDSWEPERIELFRKAMETARQRGAVIDPSAIREKIQQLDMSGVLSALED